MKPSSSVLRMTVVVLMLGTFCTNTAHSQRGGKGGGGGGATSYSYGLTDLLGFSSNGYQSRPYVITNRDAAIPDDNYPGGNVQIYGVSRLYIGSSTEFHPALWHVNADGDYPASDPVDLGLPGLARGVDTNGFNAFGFGVVDTTGSGEQDSSGNYLFPSYVDVPGTGYVELSDFNGGRETAATGINDLGQVVGTGRIGTSNGGLLWQLGTAGLPGTPVSLGDFHPNDINNYGVMAGSYQGYVAIAWFQGNTLQINALTSTLRSFGATPEAINDCPFDDPKLTVVGTSWLNEAGVYQLSDSIRGLVWQPNALVGSFTVLPTLGGDAASALDVNRSGDVVGYSSLKRGGEVAFVYSNGKVVDLNTQTQLGAQTLQRATGINDDGDIIGFMHDSKRSEQRGFLLRPVNSN